MAEKKAPLIKVMTPKGAARFPALIKADTKFNPDGEFKIGVVLSADATNQDEGRFKGQSIMQMLEDAAQGAYDQAKADLEESVKTLKGEKLAKAKKALAELKKGGLPAKPVYDEEGNETGEIVLNFKMKAQRKDKAGAVIKMKPKLFDAKGKPCPASVDVWGGSIVKVAGSLNPFYMPGTSTAGVGLRLAAVQVIELRSANSGDAGSYGFGKEEGYEAGDDEPTNEEGFGNESGDEGGEEF